LWHCSAHILKALRNAFYQSRPDGGKQGTRILRNTDVNVPITWGWISNLFQWDQQYHKGARTELKFEAVYLSGFGSMNMQYAKSICSDKVIVELMDKAYSVLKLPLLPEEDPFAEITKPQLFRKTTRKSFGNSGSLLRVGRLWAMCDHLDTAGHWPAEVSDVRPTLRVLVFLNEVFTETLLHKEEKLTAANIESLIIWLKHRMQFMADWKAVVNDRREHPPANANQLPPILQQFLSPDTWINMRMCISGFLEFNRYFLTFIDPNATIPMLFSTSSAIEVVFSQLRGGSNNGLDPRNATTKLGTVNLKSTESFFVKKNSSYSGAGLNDQSDSKQCEYRTKKAHETFWAPKRALFDPFRAAFSDTPSLAGDSNRQFSSIVHGDITHDNGNRSIWLQVLAHENSTFRQYAEACPLDDSDFRVDVDALSEVCTDPGKL
jgi:hypothetical protein